MDNEYTYEIVDQGYVIKVNGQVRYVQKDYIPYPGKTIEESAQNHIDQIIADMNKPAPETEIERLRNDLDDAILELSMAIAMQGGGM